MFSIELNLLIGFFIILVVYTLCRQKTSLPEITVIIVAICIILYFTSVPIPVCHPVRPIRQEGFTATTSSQPGPKTHRQPPSRSNQTPPCTAGEQGLVYGNVTTYPTEPTQKRIAQVIYANDIINFNLPQSNNRLVLPKGQTQLNISDQPQTYLQKLRIIQATSQSAKSKPTLPQKQLIPIRYGDVVKLIFTMGLTTDYYISAGQTLGLTKQDTNNRFQIINGDSEQSRDAVNNGDNIKLKIYSEAADPLYIMVNDINQILTNQTYAQATLFAIQLSLECNPNWRFDSSDPYDSLITKQNANTMLGSFFQGKSQQTAAMQSQTANQTQSMNQTYTNKLQSIMQERTQLQTQINAIKQANNAQSS